MPLGERITDTGLLLKHGNGFVLERDDGGTWRLDISVRHRELLGRRVRVTGTRGDFDLIDVDKMIPVDTFSLR